MALAVVMAAASLVPATSTNATTVWHVVWVGGQSNSVGTNSQTSGYPTWATTDKIQMFCWSGRGCEAGSFTPATVPMYNEVNVGFGQTFANLLLPTLPEGHGIVLLNTGVGGTGFVDKRCVTVTEFPVA